MAVMEAFLEEIWLYDGKEKGYYYSIFFSDCRDGNLARHAVHKMERSKMVKSTDLGTGRLQLPTSSSVRLHTGRRNYSKRMEVWR